MDTPVTETPALHLERRFAAPPEAVFEAWTSAQWALWLGPGEATCQVIRLEPWSGGFYELRMTMPSGRVVNISGRYLEVRRPERLVFTWMGDYNRHETLIALTLRQDADGTLMTLRQTQFPDIEQLEGHRAGWSGLGGSFDKLARVLAR